MKLQFSCNLVFALKKSNYVPLILLFKFVTNIMYYEI